MSIPAKKDIKLSQKDSYDIGDKNRLVTSVGMQGQLSRWETLTVLSF